MASHELLSWDSARERMGGSEETLAEVAQVFLDVLPEMTARLRDAVSACDAAAVREAAHTMKGSCLAIGATNAADLALGLEQRGAADDLGDADAAWARLEAALGRLERELRARLAA